MLAGRLPPWGLAGLLHLDTLHNGVVMRFCSRSCDDVVVDYFGRPYFSVSVQRQIAQSRRHLSEHWSYSMVGEKVFLSMNCFLHSSRHGVAFMNMAQQRSSPISAVHDRPC